MIDISLSEYSGSEAHAHINMNPAKYVIAFKMKILILFRILLVFLEQFICVVLPFFKCVQDVLFNGIPA